MICWLIEPLITSLLGVVVLKYIKKLLATLHTASVRKRSEIEYSRPSREQGQDVLCSHKFHVQSIQLLFCRNNVLDDKYLARSWVGGCSLLKPISLRKWPLLGHISNQLCKCFCQTRDVILTDHGGRRVAT